MAHTEQEAHTGEIVLRGEEPETVEAVLAFVYTGDYDRSENDISETATPMTEASSDVSTLDLTAIAKHVRVFVAADKYDIVALKLLAFATLRETLEGSDDEDGIFYCIQLTYQNTRDGDRDLRNLLLSTVLDRIHTFLPGQAFKAEIGTFGVELLRAILRKGAPGLLATTQFCRGCRRNRNVYFTKRDGAKCYTCNGKNLRDAEETT